MQFSLLAVQSLATESKQLRDNNLETYWQSDGSFPHCINIQFLKKVAVSKVCLYLDFSLDESYTPKKLTISSGTSSHDLIDISIIELNDPVGWVVVCLTNEIINTDETKRPEVLKTHLLQIKVVGMHQNGRDTHIRQIKVLGPRSSPRVMGDYSYDDFKTVEMSQFAVLR
jgi:anaphase-promoting complex subunit 10